MKNTEISTDGASLTTIAILIVQFVVAFER